MNKAEGRSWRLTRHGKRVNCRGHGKAEQRKWRNDRNQGERNRRDTKQEYKKDDGTKGEGKSQGRTRKERMRMEK